MTLRKVIKTRASFPSEEATPEAAVPGLDECFQEMEGGNHLANGAESFHFALWRPDGGGVGPALTIADRAYAPKPGAPARPAIVREACQQLAGERRTLEKRYLLTQNRKHYLYGQAWIFGAPLGIN